MQVMQYKGAATEALTALSQRIFRGNGPPGILMKAFFPTARILRFSGQKSRRGRLSNFMKKAPVGELRPGPSSD